MATVNLIVLGVVLIGASLVTPFGFIAIHGLVTVHDWVGERFNNR